MNFDLTDDQRAIKRTARDFLAARYPPAEVRRLASTTERGFDRPGLGGDLRARLAGAPIAEEHGGLGLGVVELAVVQEELGSALAPSPFLSTVPPRRSSPTPAATSSANAGCRRWRPARRAARSPRCSTTSAGPRCPTPTAPT